jgi:hypothetical protein
MNQKIPLRQLKYTPGAHKQAICHPQIMGWFSAILVCFLLIHAPRAEAQSPGNAIEQNFASSLRPVSSEALGESGAWAAAGEIAEPAVEALMVSSVGAGPYAFISQGRPIRLIGKN